MRGGYILFLELEKAKTLKIGRLGEHRFPAGLYAYAGSGLGSVEARIGRHLSEKKTRKWHIDYLTAEARTLDYIAFESKRKIECDLAKSMEGLGGKHLVKGFGSSDCGCESHLIYLGGLKVANIKGGHRRGT
jgi:Uri superfamily endonuclease